MKRIHVLLASALLLFFTACNKVTGEGPVVSEDRNYTDYEGIELELPATVTFTQDSVYKITLQAQKNVLPEIQTFVSDGNLVIRLVHNIKLRKHDPINVTVSGPVMRTLRVSGSGDIVAPAAIATDALQLDVIGSGNITLADVTTEHTGATVSGSGTIKVHSGVSTTENLNSSGSGTIELSNVAAQKAAVVTSGSGNVRLQVAGELKVNISGSGSVFYKGNPVIDMHVSGSGQVVRL